MHALTICRLVVLGTLFSHYLLAQPYFLRKDVLVGIGAYGVVPGDFNGDKHPDLAVGTADGVYVLLNSGTGDFARPVRTAEPTTAFWLPQAADFNGDGWDDLIGSGFLYLSRGDGTFLPPRYLGFQEAVASDDFDGDGDIDLLISNYVRGEGVRVLLGNGDGTFRLGATVTATPMTGVHPVDLDGNGGSDVATVFVQPGDASTPTKIFILAFLGQGDGTFTPEVRTELDSSRYFYFADFNGDGPVDILTWGYQFGSEQIMLGNGDGSFRPGPPLYENLRGFPVAAADFTGDGHVDLVTSGQDRFFVCPGKGDGAFLPTMEQSGAVSYAVTATDLDGDGRPDLATANYTSNMVSVLLTRQEWTPRLRRAVSAASDIAIVAPGSLATLYAPVLVTAEQSATPPWPSSLGGMSLELSYGLGSTFLAPLLFVSPTQVNFRVPESATPGEVELAIQQGDESTVVGGMHVGEVAPRLFAVPDTTIPAATGILVEPDGSQTPVPVYSCVPWPGGWSEYFCDCEFIPLSAAGDRPIYLSFFGTGFHGANPVNVTCTVNGLPVPVTYAGPQPDTPGLDQINIQLIPEVLETLESSWVGEAQVVFRIDGVAANGVWIYVE